MSYNPKLSVNQLKSIIFITILNYAIIILINNYCNEKQKTYKMTQSTTQISSLSLKKRIQKHECSAKDQTSVLE